jgi:hypothetical protein
MSDFSLKMPTYLEPAWTQLTRDGKFSNQDLASLKQTAASQTGNRVQEALEIQTLDVLTQKLASDSDGSLRLDKVQLHPQSQSTGHALLEVSLLPDSPAAVPATKAALPMPPVSPNSTEPAAAELDWASQLETKMQQQKYQPNAQEIESYKDITQRYLASRQGKPAPTPSELEWANTIQRKAQSGVKPTADELGRFRDIVARQALHVQAAQARLPEPTQAPSQEDLNWAMDLKQRVEQKKYQPNGTEITRFQQIGRAYQKFSQPAPAAIQK